VVFLKNLKMMLIMYLKMVLL